MDTHAILERMHDWIASEIENAERPGMEPFTLTSLAYCVAQVCDADAIRVIMPLLRDAVRLEQLGTHDVFTPDQATRIIERVAREA